MRGKLSKNKNSKNFQNKFWTIGAQLHMKEHEKLCLKMVSEIMHIFVGAHLCLWKDVSCLVKDLRKHSSVKLGNLKLLRLKELKCSCGSSIYPVPLIKGMDESHHNLIDMLPN